MIVDPGAEAERILRIAEKLGLSIILIVATHLHADHISALSQVKEGTGADYAVHEAEVNEKMAKSFSRVLSAFTERAHRSLPRPDRILHDRDKIEIGELQFNVLHTPGHSPGGICLEGHGVVFCGDTLFNLSIGRTDFPGCSHTQLMNSIHNKLMVLPDDTIAYPGHGPETTIGLEREYNPFLKMAL